MANDGLGSNSDYGNESSLTRVPPPQTAGQKLVAIMRQIQQENPKLPMSRVRQMAFEEANEGDEIRVPSRSERRQKVRR